MRLRERGAKSSDYVHRYTPGEATMRGGFGSGKKRKRSGERTARRRKDTFFRSCLPMEIVSGRFMALLVTIDREIRKRISEIGRDRRNSGSGKREAGRGPRCDGRNCCMGGRGTAGAGDLGAGEGSGLTEVVEDICEIAKADGGSAVHVAAGPGGGDLAEVVEDDGKIGEIDGAVDVDVSDEDCGSGSGVADAGGGASRPSGGTVDDGDAVEILLRK
jgi:hypothetical protein